MKSRSDIFYYPYDLSRFQQVRLCLQNLFRMVETLWKFVRNFCLLLLRSDLSVFWLNFPFLSKICRNLLGIWWRCLKLIRWLYSSFFLKSSNWWTIDDSIYALEPPRFTSPIRNDSTLVWFIKITMKNFTNLISEMSL